MSLLTPIILTRSRMTSLLFVLLVTLIGSTCGPGNPISPEKGGSASAPSNERTSTTTASAGDKIGVPECDDFIAKYEACVSGKVPEMARAQFNTMLKNWRDSWRQAASTPQGKAGLAAGCKQTAEQAKTSMKSYGCEF